ncbi:MAG TPA: glycosyltransferase [Longimicrobiaceae bacterium]
MNRTEILDPGGAALHSLFAGRAATASALLLLAGERADASGWGARAAVEVAAAAARLRRPVVLVDLGFDAPALHEQLGLPDEPGVGDVLLFGTSVRRAARPVEGRGFALLPAGLVADDPAEVLAHPHWDVVLAEVARAGGLLLLYLPAGTPGLADLAARVPGALLLAEAGETGPPLPAGCELLAVLPAPAPEGREEEEEPAADAAPEVVEPEAVEPVAVEPAAVVGTPVERLPVPFREEPPAAAVEAAAAPGAGAPQLPHSRYSVPNLPAWQEAVIRTVAVLTLLYGTYYIGWRWTSTLNPDALWFSVPLALAETWGLLTAFIMVHSVWRLKHRHPAEPPADLSVDVFITAYDEPLEVIRRTAVGAAGIRYPHRTWLLDDGKRDEVRAVAEELGIGYLRREGNEHAKAGNLNHALANTGGDFILQLDADHVPLPHILDRLLGFFEDPKLAFVQSPQDFYNTDGFTYDLNEEWQRIWEEQRLFFSVIQPGKDSLNCAFFCGSCALFRREALDSVGGFSTHTVTEDIETSLRLHAAGWRSAYYGESLAYGLAAGSATAFHVQHLRWGQGAMQVLRRFNPLTHPGLSFAQRVSYFGSLTAYVGGVQKLVFYSAPLVFFLTGALPIRAIDRDFLVRFLPFLALSFLLSEMVSRGTASTWISERYHMAKFWTYTRACASIFRRRPGRFNVTPKGPGHVPFGTYAPHVALMALTAVAVVWATLAFREGWIEYGVDGWRSAAFRANFLWAGLNFLLAASVVDLSLRVRQQRSDHRFRDRFAMHVRVAGPDDDRGRTYLALSENLNPGGIGFRVNRPLDPGTRVRLVLPLVTGTFEVDGEVVHSQQIEDPSLPMFRCGVRFHDVPFAVRDAIELHCTQHAVPLEHSRYRSTLRLLARTTGWMRDSRSERRRPVRLPARVLTAGTREAPGGKRTAFLEEISEGGARLVMDEPVAPGTPIRFRVPGTSIRGRGHAVFSRATETPIGVRFAIGVARLTEVRLQPEPERKMRFPLVLRRASGLLGGALALLAAAPAAVQAQLQPVVYGAAEVDTEDLAIFLLGASVNTTNPGLGFVGGVMGYSLTIPSGVDETSSLLGFQPYAGPRWGWATGAVQATAGYLFLQQDEEDEGEGGGFGGPSGNEEGLVTSLQANYWGTGAQTAQAIASYNWGAEYFWGQLRGLQRMGAGPFRFGAEVVGQTGGTGPGDDYQAIQFGPVAEYEFSPAFRLAGSIGAKSDNRPQSSQFFPYFKVDFVLVP